MEHFNLEAAETSPPTSLERLWQLGDHTGAPTAFRHRVKSVMADTRFVWQVCRGGDSLPPLVAGYFSYGSYYDSSNESTDGWLCSSCEQAGKTLGFVIAQRQEQGSWHIDYLELSEQYRRSQEAGQSWPLDWGADKFYVGLGHCLVLQLVEHIEKTFPHCRITVDASTDASRYIFLSLGFRFDPEISRDDDPSDRGGDMILDLIPNT